MANAEVIGPPRFDRAASEFVADVETHRADGRPIAGAKTDGPSQVAEIELRCTFEYVAPVDKRHGAGIAPHRDARFRVQEQHGVTASREAARRDRVRRADRVERETAD